LPYRRFGRPSGCPLLLLNYFAAAMDDWDPKVTNGLAAQREVILFDNLGVASSTGKTPTTVAAMAKDFVNFCKALNLKKIDVLGFSLGGMIAQQLAFQHPDMVRRMILVGTGPMGGEGMTFSDALLDDLKDPVALLMRSFFTPSVSSQAAGRAYLERLQLRKADRDAPVSLETAAAQLNAIRECGAVPSSGRYAMLDKIRQPVLVVHGNQDIQADVISIHLILNGRTGGLVSAAELALMKLTARLVNTSRGPIVVEADLLEALRNNKIAGAAVDVFDQEPLPPDHPFRSQPNLLATPHIGYVSRGLYERFYQDTVNNIVKWIDDQAHAARQPVSEKQQNG
jgi:pimeloyl-ACP methyl ester carboxylesterase